MKRASLLYDGKFALGITLGALSLLLFALLGGYLGVKVFENNTLFGAIIGGILAGSFSLIATLLTNFFLYKRDEKDRRNMQEASLSSLLLKTNDFVDLVVKCYRHHLDPAPDLNLFYGSKRLSKPLKYPASRVIFSDDEKLALFQLNNARILNEVTDIERMSQSLSSLLLDYEVAFEGVITRTVKSQSSHIVGRHVSGEYEIHPIQLMEVENFQEHLISSLWRMYPQVMHAQSLLIEILNDEFGRKFEFKIEDMSSQAPNFFEVQSDEEMMHNLRNALIRKL